MRAELFLADEGFLVAMLRLPGELFDEVGKAIETLRLTSDLN
jgi:hypothetical protein